MLIRLLFIWWLQLSLHSIVRVYFNRPRFHNLMFSTQINIFGKKRVRQEEERRFRI